MCSVGRQRERYERSYAEYVQFVDDKKRQQQQQQLTYNDEQIHKYRRYIQQSRPSLCVVGYEQIHKYRRYIQ